MSRPEDEPVPRGHAILRLPNPPPDFEPDDYLPSGASFVLSSDEKRGTGRLSVWDETLTTVAQARELRGKHEVLVLRGKCGDVVAAGATCDKMVEVVYEPASPAIAGKPGADGHAGIGGLRRPKEAGKREYRDLREAIADCFELVP